MGEYSEIMATDIDERMEEGFQVVAGRKHRRVASSASSTVSEVPKAEDDRNQEAKPSQGSATGERVGGQEGC